MKEESNTKPIVSNPTEERLETIPVNDNHLLYNDSPNKEIGRASCRERV